MNNMNLDIEFIYCSHFKNAKILRDFIEVIWKEIGLEDKDMSRFILVIDELNNNAIEYWSDECWKNMLRVKMINNWDSMDFIIEVEDNWKWKKHKTALEMETLRAHQLKLWYGNHESIRWRGLFMIIVKSVDRLYFRDTDEGWLIVWIKKHIKI
jgi:anti-sigma regulatory factor (Ser/Thr protein kinase)